MREDAQPGTVHRFVVRNYNTATFVETTERITADGAREVVAPDEVRPMSYEEMGRALLDETPPPTEPGA